MVEIMQVNVDMFTYLNISDTLLLSMALNQDPPTIHFQ